ncbi:MAG: hypothetical protein GWP14_04890 [Actinobacteria bacterium]|nr:hypothetical protein [Actinomycetota bacterium]
MISTNSTSTKPHVVLMQITPTMAENWLTNANVSNRKISDAHVNRLARDMKEGRWVQTHEGIAFDHSGVLLDGQHRLWAIIEADKTIAMNVWFNVPPEALLAIDSGKSRSIVDVLRLGGADGEVNKNEIAILRAILSGYHSPVTLTIQETAAALAWHREAIRFAIRHLPSVRARGLCNSVTRAVLARAYYGIHHQQLAEFGEMLASGIVLDIPSAPAIVALRQYLLTTRGLSFAERKERYGKTERALMAYLHNEPIRKLISSNREYFPLPEEMED